MERPTLGLSMKDHLPNNEIRRQTRVQGTLQKIKTLMWNWAGHVARIR